jgi:hypothetical protein
MLRTDLVVGSYRILLPGSNADVERQVRVLCFLLNLGRILASRFFQAPALVEEQTSTRHSHLSETLLPKQQPF